MKGWEGIIKGDVLTIFPWFRASARDVAIQLADASFGSRWYQRHNQRRLEHLASLRLDLVGKSVLEVGAGVGDHVFFFLDRDCSVVSLEARDENCHLFTETIQAARAAGYTRASRVKLIQGDAESLGAVISESFDIVYCYGLLYHLNDPAAALRTMAARCLDLLLLESCVSFGDHEAINTVSEHSTDPTQSVRGCGCRPTRPWIMSQLKSLFPYVYVPSTQPAHEEFPLDWSKARSSSQLTRATFVASRNPIRNELFLDYLPVRYSLS
ncbi:MAG: class I SAM-dependent methyltransferase [Alphaproteobacteria bacterium]|nr:class I SAM-dependent methyltransferase [Alphaproteobacteria bacterium]